jgi:quinol monooxygenase YgiN
MARGEPSASDRDNINEERRRLTSAAGQERMTVEILIVGTIEVEPQRRGALLEAVRPYVERTRVEEPGCLDYAFMADTVDDDRIVVVERWADEESLAAHFAHANMAATKRALHENGSGASHIAKYRVDRAEPVRDAEGRYSVHFAAETRT